MTETVYHGKLHHAAPAWVPSGAKYHIRISLEGPQTSLTDVTIGTALLDSAYFYHVHCRWYVWILLLMPDHLHSIATFPPGRAMARVVGDWKRYQEHRLGIRWQQNFFDHRLRNEDEFAEKITYIRMNPVRKELCSHLEDWPWNIEPWKRSS